MNTETIEMDAARCNSIETHVLNPNEHGCALVIQREAGRPAFVQSHLPGAKWAWFALIAALTVFPFLPASALAQSNYEIQIYGSELVAPGKTLFELHNNFTFVGTKQVEDGFLPTEHQDHETVEITHGFTDYFETGFYIFTAYTPGHGYSWVGDHIRPRFAIPESWHWPVGLSISNEIGYARPPWAPDTWTWEIRPIIDKQMGRFYWSINPDFDRSFHGPSKSKGYEFEPQGKISYNVTKLIAVGAEYYTSLGDITGFDPLTEQSHQIFGVIDLNVGPKWEVEFGPGWGLTRGGDSPDHMILKLILGRRFDW
ncbi:MAG: hypothetical protein ACRD1I_00215 [Terriglobia bacterium]